MTNLDKLPKAELRECPHCGGTDIQDRGAPGHYSVECGCFRGGFETRQAARDCWNTRHPTPSAAPDGLRLVPIDGNTQYTEMLRIFKRKMEADGTGYRELERLTGIDHATLQRFLKKQRPTNPENFLKLCAWSGYRLTAAPSLAAQGEHNPKPPIPHGFVHSQFDIENEYKNRPATEKKE